MNEACANCRFFKERGQFDGPDRGSCHRRAPTGGYYATGDGGAAYTTWPTTLAGEWCGEFEGNTDYCKAREDQILQSFKSWKPRDFDY